MTISGQAFGPIVGTLRLQNAGARPERVGTLAMSAAGPMSWEGIDPFQAWPDARRFEGIAVRGAAVAGLGAWLAFAEEVGEQRFEQARAMAEYARKRIASKADVVTEPDQATIVSFAPRKVTPEEVVRRLAEHGVIVRLLPEERWVRASLGYWTNEDDIERLVAGLP